jgi:hypothetical protein
VFSAITWYSRKFAYVGGFTVKFNLIKKFSDSGAGPCLFFNDAKQSEKRTIKSRACVLLSRDAATVPAYKYVHEVIPTKAPPAAQNTTHHLSLYENQKEIR